MINPNPDEGICPVCVILKEQLEFQQRQNKFLLDKLFPDRPLLEPPSKEESEEVIKAPIPWAAKRRLLEAEDRALAETMRKRAEEIAANKAPEDKKKLEDAQSTEELEEVLDIPPADKEDKRVANG